MLTQHELKQVLRYDPDTGLFFRLVDKRSGKPGKETGSLRKDGYVMVKVSTGSRTYRAHQLAFLYMTGDIPATVDHINGSSRTIAGITCGLPPTARTCRISAGLIPDRRAGYLV